MTGPDEYSALADNNVYTNRMAQQNLRPAAQAAARHPEGADRLGVTAEEAAAWPAAAAAMRVPYDERLGARPRSEGLTERARWDFAATAPRRCPLLPRVPSFDLYRGQAVEQADLVLAMHLRGDAFTPERKARNFACREALTARGSSLSARAQAVIAVEAGHLDVVHGCLGEAALMDLGDLRRSAGDGLRMACLAGRLDRARRPASAACARQGRPAQLRAARPPDAVTRLAFRLLLPRPPRPRHGHRQRRPPASCRPGAMAIVDHGERIAVGRQPATCPIPPAPAPRPGPADRPAVSPPSAPAPSGRSPDGAPGRGRASRWPGCGERRWIRAACPRGPSTRPRSTGAGIRRGKRRHGPHRRLDVKPPPSNVK